MSSLSKKTDSFDNDLGTLDAQKKKYFKLYEADVVDNEFLIQRMNESKQQHEALLEEGKKPYDSLNEAPPTRFRCIK